MLTEEQKNHVIKSVEALLNTDDATVSIDSDNLTVDTPMGEVKFGTAREITISGTLRRKEADR